MKSNLANEALSKNKKRTLPAFESSPAIHPWVGCLLLLVATFLVYAPALRAGFIWDDNDMLTENHLIHAADGLRRIWFGAEFVDYFPLTMSSLWIEWRLWHGNALGYHVTNVLLHALTSVLFWRVLQRLKIPGAWWAGLVFALHPVNVESVAWITERKNTLSLFFFTLSLLCHLRSDAPENAPRVARRWHWFSLGAFVLSLLAKTSGVMLPFVLLGLAWWQRGKIVKSDGWRTAPFFGAALAMGLVTIWFQYRLAITDTVVNTHSFGQRLVGAGWAVWFYLGKALLPLKLTFVYPRWEIDAQKAVNYLPGVAVFLVGGALWFLRKKGGRAPLFAFGYFVVTLFPVLGFFNIYFQRYSLVADHWQYVSIMGLIALVVGAAAHGLKQNFTFFGMILAGICAVLSWKQTAIYQNQETLWRDTLRKNPRCWMAEGNWGLYLFNQTPPRFDEAMAHYRAALAIKPDEEGALYNLGVALLQTGKAAEAAAQFETTLRVNPHHQLALASLAFIRAADRHPELRHGAQAVRLATRAVELTKGEDEWNLDTLAAAYAEAGQFTDAIKTQQKAMEVATRKQSRFLSEMQHRLELYRAGRPFHEGE